MLRKTIILVFQGLCFFLFLALVLSLGFGYAYFGQTPLRFLLPLIPSLLILPISYSWMPKNWRPGKKIFYHFSTYILLVVLVAAGSALQNSFLKAEQFSYHYGNGAGPFKILFRNSPGQFLMKKMQQTLPYSAQYMVLAAEDASRVFEIKSLLESSAWKELCPSDKRYTCFKKIYSITQKNAPFNSTGIVLIMASGANLIFAEKKENKIGNKSKNQFEALENVLDLSALILKDSKDNTYLDRVLELPPVTLTPEQIELVNQYDKEPSLFTMVTGKFSEPILKGVSDIEIEAYVLRKVEIEIFKKFDASLGEKVRSMKENGLKSLKSKEAKKNLSQIEIENYRVILEKY